MNQPGKVIRIDGDVLELLRIKAGKLGIPFSNENNTIRIILGLEPMTGPTHKPTK